MCSFCATGPINLASFRPRPHGRRRLMPITPSFLSIPCERTGRPELRMRRRQRAEQVARQAPVKMVFPLVFFLMPSLFIVTIGPVVLSVIDTVNNK